MIDLYFLGNWVEGRFWPIWKKQLGQDTVFWASDSMWAVLRGIDDLYLLETLYQMSFDKSWDIGR